MPDRLFRFGRCQVHIGTRELCIDGQPQVIEPRPFDLLVYLLSNRDREVSKDELLDHVWQGEFVSVGSVARAVMKARQAIGDVGEPPLIRTVHRVGYRFAGEVEEIADGSTALNAGVTLDGPIRIALLPFENLTGDLTLDWMPLGLMALVGNALALNARLAPLPVETVAALLSDLPPTPCVFERAEVLKQQAGVHHVVHTRIELADREYRLDYRLLTLNRDSAGTLLAPDPIRLGRALAERLLGHLLPDAQERVDGFAPHDPWAMQVFARAMHAAVENNWARAATLLRVVLDLEPDYAEARRELQRAEQMLRPVTREVEAVAEA